MIFFLDIAALYKIGSVNSSRENELLLKVKVSFINSSLPSNVW